MCIINVMLPLNRDVIHFQVDYILSQYLQHHEPIERQLED
ncbi:unnamed protein product [Schistosoma mattheei]|uniref:Uncharacterized protein n=1 Tax=Schistosoma mattheei TaxID=31246 RepID=A0A183PCR1_9TREM|nr:unnamed protein product [Schistosoma mattheei]